MRLFFCFLCSVAILLPPMPGYSGLFSRNKVTLSEPAMSDSIDPTTQAPRTVSEVFSANTKTIYATVKLSDAPGKTEVKAIFFRLQDTEQQIAENAMVTQGTGYLSFELNPPGSGWPLGRYKVVFFLNGKETEQLIFTVTTSPAVPKQARTATESTSEISAQKGDESSYKSFQDKKIGFSFELPKTWEFQVAPASGDYVFTGPESTDESEITIIVQIIDTRMGEMTDLKTQMVDLVDQISQVPEGEVIKKDQVEVANQVAPFFLATYQAANKRKEAVEFGHSQLGLIHEPYFLLVSYAAPRTIYQEQVNIFQHMVDTFMLLPRAQ